MIRRLRNEIEELNEEIGNWLSDIELLNTQIEDARAQITDKEAKIEELEEENRRRNTLVEHISAVIDEMDVDQLGNVFDAISSIQNGETPTVIEHPTITDGIDSDDVTFDMLNDDMHNAIITLVGVKYQDLWSKENKSPEIGDILTLAKRDNISTQNTVGYTEDGISVGILPASNDKFAQLERIGASSINNRNVDLDNPILERKYKVVGVIPAAFVFLNPIYDEAENIEETVAEAVSQLDSERHRLTHNALSIDEARSVFNDEMPDHCRIHNIIEQDDCFVINYENHRANTTAEYYQTVEVERAE